MKEYTLSCSGITTRKEFHRSISEMMSFPDYYGCNLDALMDVLTDIGEDTCLHLTGCADLEAALGSYYRSLIRVLRAASREDPHFTFTLDESQGDGSQSQGDGSL